MRKLFLLGMLVVVPFVFAVQYSGTDVEEMQKERCGGYSNPPCKCCDGKGRTECTMCDGTGWRICSFVVVKELLIEEMGKKHVLIAMEKGNLSVDIAKKENVYVPVVMELVNRDM